MPTARPAVLLVPLGLGAATSLALGIYGAVHDPTGRGLLLIDLGEVDDAKRALTGVVVGLVIVQLALGAGLALSQRPGERERTVVRDVHRLVGTVAFACSIPVAFHCLWALGARGGDLRVALHSAIGCVAYGFFVAKITAVRRDAPSFVIPALGIAVGVAFLVVGATAAV